MTAPVRPSTLAVGPRLRVLSLGAGGQSLALALMAAHAEIGPMPDEVPVALPIPARPVR